ncbi:MAG TPA: cyclic nucleotide-binding domain-containing protein, partial [Gemmataceae bacterium]|nr:cyclic nucleotide-binding domain-containing protein [Gemmataceae bacterium]
MSDATGDRDSAGEALGQLTPDDRRRLDALGRRRSYRRGERILAEGTVGHDLFLLRTGYVRVERSDSGAGIALARFGPGQVFGEMAFVEETVGAASVIADEDVEVDAFDRAELRALLDADAGFAARFYRSLASALAHRLRMTTIELIDRTLAQRPVVKTGLLSERQVPDALFEAIRTFKKEISTLAKELRTGELAAAIAQARGNAICDRLCRTVDRCTEPSMLLEIAADDPFALRDVSEIAAGIGGYVVRETFSLLMQSATLGHAYVKPHGYAEDWEMAERIYRNEPEGDGLLGGVIDRWFLDRPLCRARRRWRSSFVEILGNEAAAFEGPGPLRIACLACGTSPELVDFLERTPAAPLATCIDSESDALRAAASSARGVAESITFLHADILTLLRRPGWLTLGPQRIIYALNWSDYLSDTEIRRLLDWSHDHLEPGGVLLLTNTAAGDPDVRVFECLFDWPRIARTEAQWSALFSTSRFGAGAVSVETDAADSS